MEKQEFKIGDVVRLKSATLGDETPRMTINSITETGVTSCLWFLNGELRSQSFKSETLELCGTK